MNAQPVEGAPDRDSSPTPQPHGTHVLVWDAPPAVECGALFRVKVGIKCGAGCRARDWRLEIHDHDGNAIASAAPSEAPWPGTAALYHAEVAVRAPATAGLHAWQARVEAIEGDDGADAGHAASTAGFNVRAVPAPECSVKIVAVDAASRAPVQGANLVVHPYRACTDEHGVAEVKVPKGKYRLFVSGRGYVPLRVDSEVSGDLTISAELHVDVEPSDAELWS